MITRIISDSSCELFDSADGQFRTAPLTISTDERSFLDEDVYKRQLIIRQILSDKIIIKLWCYLLFDVVDCDIENSILAA